MYEIQKRIHYIHQDNRYDLYIYIYIYTFVLFCIDDSYIYIYIITFDQNARTENYKPKHRCFLHPW